MTSFRTNFQQLVENLIQKGAFPSYSAVEQELGLSVGALEALLLDSSGRSLPDIAKFKLLALSGLRDLQFAIQVVEYKSDYSGSDSDFIDTSSGSIRWMAALDSLKDAAGFAEDKQLADYLQIPTSTLSDFRRSKTEMTGRVKLKILDHLGFHKISSCIEFFLKDETAASLKRARQRQAKKLAERSSIDQST